MGTRTETSPQAVPVAAGVAAPVAREKLGNIALRIRNVKGDVKFSASCDAGDSIEDLRKVVLAAAPAGLAPTGSQCVLVHKGKMYKPGDGTATLATCGIVDDSEVFAIMK